MKPLSEQLLEAVAAGRSNYLVPSPTKNGMPRKRRSAKMEIQPGTPPYRVVYVADADRDDFPPTKCDHCNALLIKKQVTIEDAEGSEFIVGSSCAKKIGGAALANQVKWKDEEALTKWVRDMGKLKSLELKARDFNDGPFLTRSVMAWRRKSYQPGKHTLADWFWVTMRMWPLTKKEQAQMITLLKNL